MVERARTRDRVENRVEAIGTAVLDRFARECRLLGRAALDQIDERQRRLAFAQVVAGVLAIDSAVPA